MPPSVAGGRSDLTVTVNVQTTLACEATGIPKPSVSWTKNGRALNTDQKQNLYRWGAALPPVAPWCSVSALRS